MSLRVRLFILFGSLLALLAGAELWLVRTLTSSLDAEVDVLATSVGSEVFKIAHGGLPRVHVAGGGETTRYTYSYRSGSPAEVGLPPEFRKLIDKVPQGERVMVHEESRSQPVSGPDGKKSVMVTTVRVSSVGAEGVPSGLALPEGTFQRIPGPRFLVFNSPATSPTFVKIPESGIRKTVQDFRRQLLLGSLGILGVGLAAAAFVAHRVSAPLTELSRTARAVGDGSIGAQVAVRASGEVGEAIAAFNRMSARLGELERQTLALRERQHLGELGEVARGLAHSLRNPLNAIGLSVEELAGRAPGEETDELASSARRQIRHIDQTIRSFLALASGGAGAVERLDALELVQDVVLTALHDARGRVSVRVDGEAVPLSGVAAELKAVLQALVVNAIEASPDGATVSVRVASDGGGARVTVEDAGPGLPLEVRARLFTPHVTTKPAGSGMGLFLAHRIATSRYAGDLALETLEPRGTRAVLALRDRIEPLGGTVAQLPEIRVLLVEDEIDQRRLVAGLLRNEGYAVAETGSVDAALAELERSPVDVVLSDWKLPGRDGMDLLRDVKARFPETAFVMATAYGTISHAVRAVREGADDYLTKPFEKQALLLALERTLRSRRLLDENRRLTEALAERDRLVDLVGTAPSMQQLFRRVEKLAGTDATVLIAGESGTGKELAARALHALSRRSGAAFVPVNCAAIPETLMESEFFGAEKGSYTGADRLRVGKFEAAHRGTLFLDEVGELPLPVQPKLLRALQEGAITRVGGNAELKVDVRIVAATNRDLAAEVAAGRFREDLYYRLNVVSVTMPPLRQRREDIPLLVSHLVQRAERRHGLRVEPFPPALMRRLVDYAWPGNVRELTNVVERLVLLSEAGRISPEDLPDTLSARPAGDGGYRLPPGGISWEQHEKECLRQALEMAGGNRSRAARLLDLPYKAFLYRLEKHGLAPASATVPGADASS